MVPVAFTQLVTILPNDLHDTYKMRISTGAHWPYLADADLEVQRAFEIEEYTDPHHHATVPHTLVVAPGPDRGQGVRRVLVLGPALTVPALGGPAGPAAPHQGDFDPTSAQARAAWQPPYRPATAGWQAMPDVSFVNLLVVVAVAVLAPLIVGYLPRLRVPAVVLEIIGGIIIGPSVLGWVHVDLPVSILALFGLAFLLFLAGLEIDVHRLRGRLLRFAVLGYLVTLVLAYGAGASFTALGWVSQPLLLAIALSATALGLVVPVLKDAGQVHSQVGQTALAAASVADFSAIVLLSLFFSSSGGSTGSKVVVLGAFAGLVAVTGLVVSGAARSMRLGQVLVRLQDTTAEIRVRFAVLLLVAFTALAERFGLESILGAFLAGAIVGLVDRDSASHPNFRAKLEAIGYGFLVPVFFVASGIRLDLTGLLHSPSALVRVPVFLLALLVVRGVPALLGLRANGPRATLALGLLQATSLPFLVTITQIGVVLGKITPVTAAALVCAGLLSVLIFPLLALATLRSGEAEPAEAESTEPGAVAEPIPEPHLM